MAITRKPSPAITQCELTFLQRSSIDFELACAQHLAYERALAKLGLKVMSLPAHANSPDCVFIEDPALVLDEFALINRMGTPAREHETESVAQVLSEFRELKYLQTPATLEGGDVLRNGKTLYVGLSPRTSAEGIKQLAALTQDYGYQVVPVTIRKCLHLKTACTLLDTDTLLANPRWVDTSVFKNMKILATNPGEPFSANALAVNGKVCHSTGFPGTSEILNKAGFSPILLDISELAKAEAGLSCLSLIF